MSDQSTLKRLRAYLLELWRVLFNVTTPKSEAEQRRQTQFLFVVVILMAILATTAVLFSPNSTTPLAQNVHIYMALVSPLSAGLVFGILRQRHFRLATILLVVISSCTVPIVVWINPTESQQYFALAYLTIPVLISSIVMSTRFTLVVIFGQLVWFVIVPITARHPEVSATSNIAFGYYLSASFLILVSAAHRNLLEQHHNAELEQRVLERTTELINANERLTASIQERSATQSVLERERNLLRTLIDTMPDIIFVLDREGRYVITNQAHANEIAKTVPEKTRGLTVADLVDTEIAAAWTVQDQDIMETGIPRLNSEECYPDEHGQMRWFLVSKVPLHDEHGNVTGLIGVSRDITVRKQAEEALQNINVDLERRVVERTIELSQANQLLQQQIQERLQAEEQLLYQASLLQNVSDAIISTTLTYDIITWNQAAESIYGWRAEEVIGRNFNEIVSTEYTDVQTTAEVMRSFEVLGSWQGEVLQKRRDGTAINVMSSVSHIRDRNNRPVGVIAVNRDVTRRKLTEAAERKQRLLAQSLSASTSALSSTLELDEVLELIFEYLAAIIPHETASMMLIESGTAQIVHGRGFVERGLDMEAIIQQRFAIDQYANLKQMYHNRRALVIANTANNILWRANNVTDSWIQSYIGAPVIIDDTVIGFLNLDSSKPYSFNDDQAEYLQTFANQAGIAIRNARLYQSARSYAENLEVHVAERTAELETERLRLQTILNAMSDALVGVIFDENGAPAVQYVNSALTEMTGRSADDWSFNMLRPPEMTEEEFEAMATRIFEMMLREGTYRGEHRIMGRQNTVLDVHITSTYFSTAGRSAGTVTILRDISREKALQEQKSRFVANASHELRTPLTNLTTRLYLMRRQPDRFEEHIDVLDSVTQRMRHLVEDLLDHSRFERGQIPLNLHPVDVRELVKGVSKLQEPEANKKHIELTLILPDEPLQAEVDSDRIIQVITNLVSNAIQYTPAGGLVSITAEAVQIDGEECAQISVADNGTGIDAQLLPNIFLPFYRASQTSDGTGLGLTISREIARMHGGDITVSSALGSGSTFTLHFPLKPLSPP
ncbi:MAG: PAS domain S-box protein [Anaerolineae bacterium]|nr:PAS domain S-box protein [Anaerolineae bacterium]